MARSPTKRTQSKVARQLPTDVRIRALRSEDRDIWVKLRHELWPKSSFKELAEDADALLASRKRGHYWRTSMLATVLFAETRSGEVVGFVEVDLRPMANGCWSSPVGYLEGWYVTPSHRRRGVGRALVRAAEEWARDQGCVEMGSDALDANRISHAAHAALGYEEVERLVVFRRDLVKRTR